jgi:hypothetical protein
MSEASRYVTILPGVPGMEGLLIDDDRVPYPDSTPDVAKILKELGFEVRFTEARESRRYAGHKAFELWVPILQFTIEVLVAVEAGILLMILDEFLPGERRQNTRLDAPNSELVDAPAEVQHDPGSERAFLHIDWRVSFPDGQEEGFVANGDATDVRRALRGFEDHVRDR